VLEKFKIGSGILRESFQNGNARPRIGQRHI
jgi:hypothetical protein